MGSTWKGRYSEPVETVGVSRRLANSCFFSRGILGCITPVSFCDLMMSLDFGGQSEHLVVLLLVVGYEIGC